MDSIPDKLISAYLEGTLDEQQADELSRWVQASRDNALYLASLAQLERGLVRHARVRSTSEILAELDQNEAIEQDLPPIHIDANALTKQKYVDALSYVLRHTFTPKRVVVLATAAALLLGAVITIVMLSGPDESESIVEAPDQQAPVDVPPQINPIVATLTATHNAAWSAESAEGALAPGSQLRANQRLTLTAGYVEITTNDGAIAILEAPATIELLNKNALRLHTGKLVGICETALSKGFLVGTPHMDINDVGTRFGVSVPDPGTTEMLVIQGEVLVSSPINRDDQPLAVRRNGAAIATADSITALPSSASLVHRVLPRGWDWAVVPVALDGEVIAAYHTPGSLREGALINEAKAVLIPEARNVLLTEALTVDVAIEGGERIAADSWTPGRGTLAAQTRVDAYLLHLNRAKHPDLTVERRRGALTFDSPIVGLVFDNETLVATDALVGLEGVVYEMEAISRGMIGEAKIAAHQDSLSISDDRRTLEFDIAVAAFDQLRILTQANEPAATGLYPTIQARD